MTKLDSVFADLERIGALAGQQLPTEAPVAVEAPAPVDARVEQFRAKLRALIAHHEAALVSLRADLAQLDDPLLGATSVEDLQYEPEDAPTGTEFLAESPEPPVERRPAPEFLPPGAVFIEIDPPVPLPVE
jgi:hypothetical protein